MILYFADRGFNILGYASTKLPGGLTVSDDLKTEDVESGVSSFECKIPYTASSRGHVENCTTVGNYILRKHKSENEFYTIIDTELDTQNQEVYIYAEDAGLDLLNEVCGEYTAEEPHDIAYYIDKFTYDSGFEIGINEASGMTRTLSWDGEATATERIASVATQFGNFEVSYSFDIKGLEITNKYINIYKERGKESGVQLRLNNEVDRIVTKKSIANLATALIPTGATLEGQDMPVDLTDYSYDDGDFYTSGKYLYSREALKKWTRYIWNKEPNLIEGQKGHIVQRYSYDTESQKELCERAVKELKKLCEPEVNYEIDINMLPENVAIGDRVEIVDDSGGLYVSARILKLETSVVNETQTATIGEYLIKNSGISDKVADLAGEFTEFAKGREESNKKLDEASQAAKDAQAAADEAQKAAEDASTAAAQAKAEAAAASEQLTITEGKAQTAIQKAEEAKTTAEQASTQASDAKSTADAAKLDAAAAEQDIANLGDRLTTVTTTMEADYARKTDLTEAEAHLQSQISQNAAEISSTVSKVQKIDETANNAAEQASQAQTTASRAQQQADQAVADAEAAQTAATNAASAAENAQAQADTAAAAASDAQTKADTAKAKADQAQTDLDAAKENLETVSAKADATESEVAAAHQAVIDAQAAADKAKADATAAQTAADQAAADAAQAQTVADNAKTAADNAKAAADKAQADADAAQAAVDSLAVRVTTAETKITQNAEQIELRATKTEVTETLGGYYTKEESDAAIQVKANEITQSVSTTYATKNELASTETKVTEAQTAADNAQAAADQAHADADTAAQKATAAQSAADAAQTTANTAKSNADAAQAAADAAQADVDALTTRVSTAETKITQNAEKIELCATKTEVSSIEIGGRNIIRNTRSMSSYSGSGNVSFAEDSEGFAIATFADTESLSWNNIATYPAIDFSIVRGKEVTLSLYVRSDEYNQINSDSTKGLVISFSLCTADSTTRTLYVNYNLRKITLSSEWQKVKVTVTLSDDFFTSGTGTIDDTTKIYLQIYNYSLYSMQIKKIKLELGNKATDWTPAPEDIDQKIEDTATEIYDTIETNSTAITETCESIILEALTEYTATGDFESFKETVNSQLTLLADQMELKFTETTEQLESVNDDLQEKYNTITKYFVFDINGLTIGQEDNPNKVLIDNDEISILVNDAIVQKFDSDGNALTPSLKVTESFDLFGYAVEKDDNGNVNCIYKG